ncbi:MAG: LytTR family transcriptional regulator DNA-binding domain-containing protein [Xanthobacteraceae bacterium]|nr:LytTR family transcriptional regulator DNA-binding domain-containing protein [Xanthobacteraceae bacterium]
MLVTYEPWLVLLSIVMAIQGAYVGLSLAIQIGEAAGLRRRTLLAAAAFSLAVAIWTMHFVGMLAARLPFPVDYLVFPTLLSFLVCVIVVGIAVYATSSGPLTLIRLTLSACLMGVGIFSMHYIGMTALHASAHMIHNSAYVAASMAVAIAASGLALWLAAGRGGRPPLVMSAVAFGIAVSGMHYTAMLGMTLYPHGAAGSSAPALSTDLLAIVVAVVAFCVSGIFLLFLVPDRASGDARLLPSAALPAVEAGPATEPPSVAAELGRGSYAPLGGAGGPPAKLARRLPVEREGATEFIAVANIVAVHANAHYTYIFNGSTKLFCPLAIGEIEARLDKDRFVRVHRSHIVNIDRVIGLRRSGDSEMVELAAEGNYAVPVSRSRVGWVKSRVRTKSGAEASPALQHLAAQQGAR